MKRFKERTQDNMMVRVNLDEQPLSVIFEFTLNEVIDHQLDLSVFDEFYNNDEAGPKVYSPQAMLKIVMYAYSKGLHSSRKIKAVRSGRRRCVIFLSSTIGQAEKLRERLRNRFIQDEVEIVGMCFNPAALESARVERPGPSSSPCLTGSFSFIFAPAVGFDGRHSARACGPVRGRPDPGRG
jgi:transposase